MAAQTERAIEPGLARLVQEVVNSRAKLDVLYYFHRNPYAWESLTGLARRLHRAPLDIEAAVLDLSRDGLLVARSGRVPGNDLVYNYCHDADRCREVALLMKAYEGPERSAILQAIMERDNDTRLRALARRRALDDMRTRFVSMVTHELRTPVTVIRSVLSTLSSAQNLGTPQAETLLQRGIGQCDRLASLVENLLVLSGMQTGRKLELYLSEVEVPRLVAELRDRVAGSSKHVLRFVADKAPAVVVADEYLLGQMLEELVRNAIKFSPEGGTITVTVTQEDDRGIFTVEDEGIGMSQVQIDRVFEPFYQAEQDASRLAGGLGVGLFMARNITESHGGQIWLEPNTPRGLRVGFSLPLGGPSPEA